MVSTITGENRKSKDPEQIGVAICKLIAALYGDEGLDKLMTFYDGDYVAMAETVMAHIREDVLSALEKINTERVKNAKKVGRRR